MLICGGCSTDPATTLRTWRITRTNMWRRPSRNLKNRIQDIPYLLLEFLFGKNTDLVMLAQSYRKNRSLRLCYQEALNQLLKTPLIYMDIGARGGEEKLVKKYKQWFFNVLVEPSPESARAVPSDSAILIDELIGEKDGRSVLNLLREPALSGVLKPNKKVVNYFTANPDHYDVIGCIELPMTTISTALRENQIDQLDYLKIDTQGTELSVLKGLGEYAPLIIKTEISFMPLYKDNCLFWEISEFLAARGYVMFDLTYHSPAPPQGDVKKGRNFSRIPMHGDAFFMPDWTREKGINMIYHRDLEFAALLLMLGLEENLRYILTEVDTPDRQEILRAI